MKRIITIVIISIISITAVFGQGFSLSYDLSNAKKVSTDVMSIDDTTIAVVEQLTGEEFNRDTFYFQNENTVVECVADEWSDYYICTTYSISNEDELEAKAFAKEVLNKVLYLTACGIIGAGEACKRAATIYGY